MHRAPGAQLAQVLAPAAAAREAIDDAGLRRAVDRIRGHPASDLARERIAASPR